MTKKDYIGMACAFKAVNSAGYITKEFTQNHINFLAEEFAKIAKHDNPNFNSDKFIKACK